MVFAYSICVPTSFSDKNKKMKTTFLTGKLFAYFLSAAFLIFLTSNLRAQNPDTEWNFVYFDSFPHQVWGCPYCGGTSPVPTTKIAYGSDYYYFQGNQIINHEDKTLFATLNGGVMLGGNYDTQDCRFGIWGYGTYSTDVEGTSCSLLSDKLDVSFSEPVVGKRVTFWGAYPQRLKITESGRLPIFLDLSPEYDDQGQLNGHGYGTALLSLKKISGLTVESDNPTFHAFSIDTITANRLSNPSSSPVGTKPPPNYCGIEEPQARPTPENISRFGWTMHSEISDSDGLVLTDVRLNDRLMAERISIPYYRIETNSTPSTRGELRPNDTSGTLRSRLVSYDPVWDGDRLFVRATYAIDNVPSSAGCLIITQEYEFTRAGLDGPCEPNDSITCQKYRARVRYNYTGDTTGTFSVSVAQRNHFTVNGASNNSVGLFRDCDNGVVDCVVSNFGVIFKDKINPLFTEYYSPVIVNGKDNKLWDNMHQTPKSLVTEPPAGWVNDKWVWGGCPECLHTHWRWGANVPNSDHFGSGALLLPKDTTQDLSIGIVRNHAGEEHPDNFEDLISSGVEPIRSLTPPNPEDMYSHSLPEDVDYWLIAKGRQNTDDFFSYYSFFNPDSPNEVRPISEASGGSGFVSTMGPAAPLSVTDSPVSIIFGHLYEDSEISYTEIDPSTIAPLPGGYTGYNGVSYDIRTQAEASGLDVITFNLPSVTDQTTFDGLRVLHSEPDPFDSSQAIWVDRTVLPPDTPAPDFANRNIYATVNDVGPFLIANYTPPSPNTNIADLSVSISDSADPVTSGNQLTYTANITNNGPDAATKVIFNDGLSPDVIFVSVNAAQGTCNDEDAMVMCKLGTIAPGSSVTVTVVVEPYEGQISFPAGGKTLSTTTFVRANEGDPDEVNNSDIENTNALPNPNSPPTTQIQSPSADAIFAGPANFTAIVGAADSDGTISQVELFTDGVSAGNATLLEAGKYAINLVAVPYGEHSLIAVATDNGGRKSVSDPVHIFVNGPIIVTLDTPSEGDLLSAPATVSLSATATNDSGTVSQVEFLSNGLSVGNGVLSGTDQFNLTWNNMPIGSYSVRTVATDGNGVKSWSESASIYIGYTPTLDIIAPATGASYSKNSSITLTASAKDLDGYVSSVEFLIDGFGSIGTAAVVQGDSFALTWENVQAGTYSVTAKATDDTGLITISSPIMVTVTNNPPTVSMTNPANGATFSPLPSMTLSADAADSDGYVTQVDFYDGSILLGTANYPPYEFSWSNIIAGTHTLTAKATDDNTAFTISSPVSITAGSFGDALLVVGNTTLSSVDTAIKTRLQNLGLNVVVKSAISAVAADATGKLVVVISDSVTPTDVNTKFKTVAIPVVTLDPQLFDDMGMTPTASSNFGTTTSQKNVTITNASHPMAGGLSGTVQVTTSNTTFAWGKPNANAAKIATLTTDSTKATDFSYASGVVMPGLTAPARRVGFFYTASSSSLTANGGLLFDNAVKWAAGL